MQQEKILEKLDSLIKHGKEVLDSEFIWGTLIYVDSGLFFGFRTSALSFLSRQVGENDPYYLEFNEVCIKNYKVDADVGLNILLSLKNDIENGWLFSYKQLITAELFSDFLEMSNHLLEENYKDAAAVMIGSVLEEHLKYLCDSNGIDTYQTKGSDRFPKKASLLNDELRKDSVYELIDNRQVMAWLDIRNSAAHGNYTGYTIEQVKLMHQGVMSFISRTK